MAPGPNAAVAVITIHADPLAHLGGGRNGGMNLGVRRLGEELAAAGVPSDTFTRLEHPDQPREELIAPGARVVRIDTGSYGPADMLGLAEAAGSLAEVIAAHAASEGRRYRLVHAHHWVSGLVAEQLQPRWGIPWAQSFHTLARSKIAAGISAEPGRDEIEARLAATAGIVICNSAAEAMELTERYGADRDRITVIELGADIQSRRDTERVRRELGLEASRVILYAGRLEPLKGTDTLLESIACLASGDGYDDVVALIVGDDASAGERLRMEQIAAETGIHGRIRFVGAVDHDDIGDYYAAADICVVPSRSESFGLVALEAQAAGTAVVAADVGGLREVVVPGETGVLVPAGDAGAFCRAIGDLLDDPETRRRYGEAGRARAAEFTWTRAAQRLRSVYARLDGEPGTPRSVS